jgi:hypothetical protein
MIMMSENENLGGTAEYYQTHDVSEEMETAAWERQEGRQPDTAMSGFNTRLPTAVLNDARAIARSRSITTGAWIREVIEAAVTKERGGDDLVPLSVLLAAAEEYHHRRAS